MANLKLACEFIPDYDLLTDHERARFHATYPGRQLLDAVEQLKNFDSSWLTFESRANKISTIRQEFISKVKTDINYTELLRKINFKHLLIQIKAAYKVKVHSQIKAQSFPRLKLACENQIFIMNLDAFNQMQAENFAKNTLSVSPIPLSSWLELYQQSLLKYIENNLGLINGKDPLKETLTYNELKDSLSDLFSYGVIKDGRDLLDKIADAHGFIQATGFSTQNENSNLVWLDIYNYSRSTAHIAEAKLTLYKLLEPFSPLFTEYHNITHHEHNVALQIMRTLMPMLIIAATVVLVAALLTPFAIPELPFFIILIPTLYIGLFLATSYVSTKDHIYHTIRKAWYGGQFEIPEFQVNERMLNGFINQDKARLVRNFYVNELHACYEKEAFYQQKTPGTLSTAELNDRKENTERRAKLQLEWFDIHSNAKLGYNEISKIALNRLRLDIKKACTLLQKELSTQLNKEVRELITNITDELKITLESVSHETPAAKINTTSTHRFFSPPGCFAHKVQAERLNTMMNELQAPSSTHTGA